MQTTTIEPTATKRPTIKAKTDLRRGPILGKTIHRELQGNGLSNAEIVAVATELLALVAGEIREQ